MVLNPGKNCNTQPKTKDKELRAPSLRKQSFFCSIFCQISVCLEFRLGDSQVVLAMMRGQCDCFFWNFCKNYKNIAFSLARLKKNFLLLLFNVFFTFCWDDLSVASFRKRNCGGHWSFPTFSINFAAPHLGFQILQVLVQGLKAEEEKRRVQSQHRWKQLGKVQCFETSVFKSL